MRVYEWCDELTRSGNLFLLLTTDAAGMSYVRAVPASAGEGNHTRAPMTSTRKSRYEMQPNWSENSDAAAWPAL